ncbi:HTH-type transcriptional regulator GltR [Thalassovita gelatinovora]|uniref:HTH-type transcriptional regulator GltR n=1 Tax=Thalassovita gelatinovora TaxID=53501 RepID=A0A0P1G734_THAGE|nr:LysR family transcriptional regulator [Thalassovita gelatinovora]QIZ81638.1 LysR family transcriptional regulator [Thalassovita gelatinovora]CUH68117.1 HTH-type transcriptional regulator GltR [Thalassovita gelatinovora]SEQ29512.1 transcriptional regulator, LysR family [Thalassovita gelatinovora]
MDNWDEIRTAFQVARMGTVSGAAEVLGVHHATVIRHIDALETQLGIKLFQRHARGYTPTEAGQDLMRVAQATDDQFSQLAGRIKGQGDGVSGELVVTSLSGLSTLLMPVMADFRLKYPEVILRYLTGDRLFRLEYGEAHVAIRAGRAPEEPDNVVQPLLTQNTALYAAKSYVDRMGKPDCTDDFKTHLFVGTDNRNSLAPFYRWLWEKVPEENIIFRSVDYRALHLAVLAGVGIGFMAKWEAEKHPDLTEICTDREDWQSSLWLVTHVDLHRTTKVQAFVKFLKERAKDWG